MTQDLLCVQNVVLKYYCDCTWSNCYNNFTTVLAFQWLKEEFLGYLDDWERSVNNHEGFTAAQRSMMLLSQQTLEGIRTTGIAIIMPLL